MENMISYSGFQPKIKTDPWVKEEVEEFGDVNEADELVDITDITQLIKVEEIKEEVTTELRFYSNTKSTEQENETVNDFKIETCHAKMKTETFKEEVESRVTGLLENQGFDNNSSTEVHENVLVVREIEMLPNKSHKILVPTESLKNYTCGICDKTFKWKKNLEEHKIIHTGKKPYECNICGKRMRRKRDVKKHQKTHTKDGKHDQSFQPGNPAPALHMEDTVMQNLPNEFSPAESLQNVKCAICPKTFKYIYNLEEHQKTHTGEKPFECSICDKNFGQKAHLKDHELTHKGEKAYKCDICDKTFKWKKNLEEHKIIHTGKKPYECNICGKRMRRKWDVKKHQKTHTKDGKNQSFKPVGSLKVHGKVHSKEKSGNDHSTLATNTMLKSKDHIQNNMKQNAVDENCNKLKAKITHGNPAPALHMEDTEMQNLPNEFSPAESLQNVECAICQKTFKYIYNLEEHQKTHTGEKPFECSICDKNFVQKAHLKDHELTHKGVKAYRCGICGKGISRKRDLRKHQITIHGEKPYRCDICHEGFVLYKLLKAHYVIHRGDTGKCQISSRTFAQKKCLEDHHKTHTAEKQYLCEICGRSTNSKSDLERHQRTHTGEKPYKCSVCDKKFRRKAHLTEHQIIHKGLKPYECDICGKRTNRKHNLKIHKRTHTQENC